MLFSVSMFPIGSSDEIAHPVAEVVDEIDRAGLPYEVSAMDTVIEGAWDDVMPVIRLAHERMIKRHDRVYMTVAVDEHRGHRSRLEGAVADLDRDLGRAVHR
jgi:uncharacterized protein (TIGR00106 family)